MIYYKEAKFILLVGDMLKKLLIVGIIVAILAVGGKIISDYNAQQSNDAFIHATEITCPKGGGTRKDLNSGPGPRFTVVMLGCDCGEGKNWNGKSGKRGKCMDID